MNPAWRFLLPLFGLWLLLYGSYALVRPPLPDGPGTIHAEIAREMIARHDWSKAYVNNEQVRARERTLDLSIAASYKLFGVADWSARLPIALCVLALTVIVFFFGRRLFVWNAAGLYAALTFLTWPGAFVATRDLTPVPLLNVEIALIAFALWHLLAQKKLAGLPAIAISVIACVVVFFSAPWPATLVPLAIILACLAARRSSRPSAITTWPLLAWAAAAYLSGGFIEAQPHNPFTWLGPVPPLALLLGGWLANREAFSEDARTRKLAYTVFVLGILAGVVLIVLATEEPLGFSFFTSSAVLTSAPGRIPSIILAASLIAGVTGNLVYRLNKNARAANCFLVGMFAGVTVAIQAALVIGSPFFSSQILAYAIRPELEPSDIVIVDGKYPEASSFAFYLERPVSITANSLDLPIPVVEPAWNGTDRVYLWTTLDHPFPVPGQSYVIATGGGKEILSNRPNSSGASF